MAINFTKLADPIGALAEAPSLEVTTLDDVVDQFDGETSLREAIDFANSQAGADTITFEDGLTGTIRLTNAAGSLVASEALTIDGDIDNNGTPDITITGDVAGNDTTLAGGITDIFNTSTPNLADNVAIIYSTGTANLTFNGLILTGGSGASGGAINAAAGLTLTNSVVSGNQSDASGGGIAVIDGDATLTNVTLTGNRSTDNTAGGIIVVTDTLYLTDSTVSGNSADDSVNGAGGGISAFNATLLRSTVSGNTAGSDGGGMFIFGDADITDSTISGNTSGSAGGGLFANNAVLKNVTVSGNSAVVGGGGVFANLDATVTNSTITGNDGGGEGGGIDVDTGTLVNSLVMGNTATNGADTFAFTGPIVLTGGNIVGTDVFSGGSDVGDTTLAAVFAAIDPSNGGGLLANNGGPVQTIALRADATNPALDAADGAAPADDARGFGRLDHSGITNGAGGSGADIGAFEAAQNTAPSAADNTIAIDEDHDFGFGYAFDLSDFGFSDTDGDQFDSVTIVSIPLKGVLYNDATGEVLQANDVVDADDIDNGDVYFIPDHDENGVGYASFTFQVTDDGGTANSGDDTSATHTITFDVTAVNDAPRIRLQPGLDVVAAEPDSDGVAIASGDGTGFLFPSGGELTGTQPEHVVLADFDGDGLLDIATSNSADDTVTILLGDGCGCFTEAAGSPIAVGDAPGGLAVGLFNNDLIPDLVVANTGANSVSMLIGNGDGTFTATDYVLAGTCIDVAVADFNEDGNLDIVTADDGTSDMIIALGNGAGAVGGFSAVGDGSLDIIDVETADINGDTHADVVGVDRLNDVVLVRFGNGAGLLSAGLTLATGNAPEDAAIGDVNGDTILDIVVANGGDDTVGVFLGTGGGAFAAQATFVAGDGPTSIALADMDEDGDLDIVAGHEDGSLHVLLGVGDGSFTPDPNPLFSSFPVSDIAIGQIDPEAEETFPQFVSYTEGTPVTLAPRLLLADVDGATVEGATVFLDDFFGPGGFDGDVLAADTTGTSITASYDPITFTLTLSALTPQPLADFQKVLRTVTFASGDDPDIGGTIPARVIGITVDDGGLDGEGLSAPILLAITAVDDPATAVNDAATVLENATLSGDVFGDNGSGADSDPENTLAVTAVNGNTASVDTQITLPSGALLTLNADGTFSYDPNGVFDPLPTAGSGASNTPGTDSFTYTVNGEVTATVTVTITGVDSDDTLFGTGGSNTLNAGIGNDHVYGSTSTGAEPLDLGDILHGDGGDDFVQGNGGDDEVYGDAGNDTVGGGQGNDTVYGGADSDIVNGGQGNDHIYGGSSSSADLLDLGDVMHGGDGDDFVQGNSGDDEVYGDAGNDQVGGGKGNDKVYGGADNDTLFGGNGLDELHGGTGNDFLYGGNSAISDPTAETDTLFGEEGDDFLQGNGGDDELHGGIGVDDVRGGQGNDEIHGDADSDSLTGGQGNDTFVFLDFDGVDTVTDFANGFDLFDLSGLITGDQNFNQLTITEAPGAAPGVTVDYGSGSFFIANISSASLIDASDFIFT